jgi:hypothetical protein
MECIGTSPRVGRSQSSGVCHGTEYDSDKKRWESERSSAPEPGPKGLTDQPHLSSALQPSRGFTIVKHSAVLPLRRIRLKFQTIFAMEFHAGKAIGGNELYGKH